EDFPMSESIPSSFSQDAEGNRAYGQQCVDYGNAHIAHHTQRLQQMTDFVNTTFGDVHHIFKKTFNEVVTPAYYAAHISPEGHGQAWIDHGTKAMGDAAVFTNMEDENAATIAAS